MLEWSNDPTFQWTFENNKNAVSNVSIVFDLEQISLIIAEHNVGWLNMVVNRSNISPNTDVQWMLGEMLDRLTRA